MAYSDLEGGDPLEDVGPAIDYKRLSKVEPGLLVQRVLEIEGIHRQKANNFLMQNSMLQLSWRLSVVRNFRERINETLENPKRLRFATLAAKIGQMLDDYDAEIGLFADEGRIRS